MAARSIGNTTGGTAISSLTLTVTDDVAADETILVGAGWGANNRTATITDSQGNTYQQDGAQSYDAAANYTRLFTANCVEPLASGVDTITVTWTGGTVNNAGMIAAAEQAISHLAARVDQTTGANGTSNSLDSGNMVTTADSLVVGFFYWQRTNTASPGSGFTEIDETNAIPNSRSIQLEQQQTSGAQTIAASATSSGGPVWNALGVAYFLATGSPPAATVDPVATSAGSVGDSASTTDGTWTGSPSVFTYQWQRDDEGGGTYTIISGATSSTYTLTAASSACNVRCAVSASNSAGTTTAYSNAVGPVYAPLGTPTALVVGQQIASLSGQWINTPTSYLYEWQRSTDGSSSWAAISGETRSDYIAAASEMGYYVRCRVRAVNAKGTSTGAYTEVAGPVVEAPVIDYFDPTRPDLAVYASEAALATFLTDAALAEFVTAASLAASVTTGFYGGGLYGSGLYGTGTGSSSSGGVFETTTAVLATFLNTPALASYDTPEPAIA